MLQGQTNFYITDTSDNIFHADIICRESSRLKEQIHTFLESLNLSIKDIRLEEITLNTARTMFQSSCRHDYINDNDKDEMLKRFELEKLCSRSGIGKYLG